MASGDVLQTSIFAGGVVEGDPAGQMSEWLSASPVGVILMPSHDTTMVRRLAKELIVPEAHRTIEQLRGANSESSVPEQVMKTGCDAPGAKGMKEYGIWIGGLV